MPKTLLKCQSPNGGFAPARANGWRSCYQVTDTGLHNAMLLTHVHTRLLQPGIAVLTDPDPPQPTPLRAAAHKYRRALDQLTQDAGLAA